MNDNPPPSKRQRIDPNAMDDDDTLPPKGQSVLGKRKRNHSNDYYYSNKNGSGIVVKGAPNDHPRNANQFTTNNDFCDDDMREPPQPKVEEFHRGHSLDIKIK